MIQAPKRIFSCQHHPENEINFFVPETKEMLCFLCVYEKGITKEKSQKCQKKDIIKHTDELKQKVIQMKLKLDENLTELNDIEYGQDTLVSDQIMTRFQNSYKLITGKLFEPQELNELLKYENPNFEPQKSNESKVEEPIMV